MAWVIARWAGRLSEEAPAAALAGFLTLSLSIYAQSYFLVETTNNKVGTIMELKNETA